MIAWGDIRPDDDSDYWDEPVYADVDREARTHWLQERPDETQPPDYDESPYDWPPFDPKEWRRRHGIPEPVDPWGGVR